MVPTTVLRHPKERMSKNTLAPLRDHPDLTFLMAAPGFQFDATGFTLLVVGAEPLTPDDADRPLLLLDATWRLVVQLQKGLTGQPSPRSLPTTLRGAHPRRNRQGNDPEHGLCSVEALYTAQRLLGEDHPELLEHYHFRDAFLKQFS